MLHLSVSMPCAHILVQGTKDGTIYECCASLVRAAIITHGYWPVFCAEICQLVVPQNFLERI